MTRSRRSPPERWTTTRSFLNGSRYSMKTESEVGMNSAHWPVPTLSSAMRITLKFRAFSLVVIRKEPSMWSIWYSTLALRGAMTIGVAKGLAVGTTRDSDDVNPSSEITMNLLDLVRPTPTLSRTSLSWNTSTSLDRGVPSTWRQTASARRAESAV